MCKSLQIISPTISWSVFLMEKMFVGLSCSWKMFKLITNRIKQKYPEKSRTISKKSRDKNMTQIPSRKIPGSRDFTKIPSRPVPEWNSLERWTLNLTSLWLSSLSKGMKCLHVWYSRFSKIVQIVKIVKIIGFSIVKKSILTNVNKKNTLNSSQHCKKKRSILHKKNQYLSKLVKNIPQI